MITPSAPPRALLVVVAVIGLAVGALVVGVLWLTIGSSEAGGSTTPLTAPAKLGDFQRYATLPSNAAGSGKSVADRTTDWNKRSAVRLSQAYNGAAATVETYASNDLQVIFSVNFVRASSPGMYAPYQDPKAFGLTTPEQDVQRFGAVQCLVHTQPTPEGSGKPAPVIAADCQRSGGGLTVRIPTVGGDLGEQPAQVAALVDQAFEAVN